ncbi:DUF4062 domain-containing protein [Rhizobium leguminosarum]
MLRRIVKVFLGSPGDLGSERKLAAEIVSEINKDHADYWNAQIELVGWEDTVAAAGRAQALINHDLDQCEYFIGLIWQRWGTPPGGAYSSGFEEEFERSVARHTKSRSPEISLLFKKPEDNRLIDPGKQFSKVLDFRQRIVDERKIYFQEFTTEREFSVKFRRLLARYVQGVLGKEQANEARTEVGVREEVEKASSLAASPEPGAPLLEPQASDFVSKMLAERDATNNVSAADVARLRLIGSSVKRPGNDSSPLGPHDANLIFARRNEFKLTQEEVSGLVTTGSAHRENENVPIWGWLFESEGGAERELVWQTFSREAALRSGLIRCLTQGRFSLRSCPVSRSDILTEWFADELDDVKYAAVDYLEHCGDIEDVEILRPFIASANSTLSERSLAAAIRILSRHDMNSAFELVEEYPAINIPERVVPQLFSVPAQIKSSHLHNCLSNRNGSVRTKAVSLLVVRQELGTKVAKSLLADDVPIVRYVALKCLRSKGRVFASSEVKQILVRTGQRGGTILTGEPRLSGEDLFKQYESDLLEECSRDQLKEMINSATIFDYTPNFALYRKFFSDSKSDLESNLEDRFKVEFDRRLERLTESIGKDNDLLTQFRSLGPQVCKTACGRALSILCKRADQSSLSLVRKVLDRDEPPFMMEVLDYLEKFGGWADAQRLANLMKRVDYSDTDFSPERQQRRVSEALLKFGKDRMADLCGLDLPPEGRALLVLGMTNSAFKDLKDGAILDFMSNESSKVRKAAALKSIISLTINRQNNLLNMYITGEKYRYYNVIFWLDAGVRTNRPFSKALAQREIPALI